MTWDDLLVNGTSLSGLGTIEDFAGIARTAPLRGDDLTIPGRAGAIFMPKVRDAYDFMVPLALSAASHGARMAALSALETLLDSATAALTLTRRLTVGGSSVSQTAAGSYVSGLEPVFLGTDAARVPLVFRNLSGGWA